MLKFTCPLVLLRISTGADGPDAPASSRCLQSADEEAAVGDAKAPSPVSTAGVMLGSGVALGSGVGGTAVFVGIAACVAATIVLAAATAEACTCSASMVGAAGAPQAVRTRANSA